MKFLIILILTFGIGIAKANDVESSWNKAQVFLPGSAVPVTVNDIKPNQFSFLIPH